MTHVGQDSLNTRRTLNVGEESYDYYSIDEAGKALGVDFSRLPYSQKVLLENMLRYEDGTTVVKQDIEAFGDWLKNGGKTNREIQYRPARVLMQDFTGVPAVVDLAAMRDAMKNLGGDPNKINPLSPVDLVIDHSVQVDFFGGPDSFRKNVELEMIRNKERYEFLRWGQKAFNNFRVVPPGTGICHQVNLEYLAQTVWTAEVDGKTVAYPDTCVGTDSHTTMINGLGVLGWGVGGIEAEAAMLGQPVTMLIPEVVGFKLTGQLKEGSTATDLVLTVVEMLRKKGVVGKFVEFYGPGLDQLPLADRATIANMAPEYGATCGIFPVDDETIAYLELSARDEDRVSLVKAYAKEQGMWRMKNAEEPVFTDTLELDVSSVEPSLAGPKRPQDKVLLSKAAPAFKEALPTLNTGDKDLGFKAPVEGRDHTLSHGDVVIAAITSCTNTSNPSVMLAAGLVARNALEKGLKVKPWVKTSLAPGSKVVTEYLEKAGLQDDLDKLGFNLAGYGCTTCIGNSGPLPEPIENAVKENKLVVAGVLSGNRNFEGRIHANVRANYLASPPLVVAYAIAGNMNIDLFNDPIGQDQDGNDVFMRDIWPTNAEVRKVVGDNVTSEMFRSKYADVFTGDEIWQGIATSSDKTYGWVDGSTYVQHPPYFEGMKDAQTGAASDINEASILALFGDSITTDHISPAGSIAKDSPAAKYLTSHGVEQKDFNSYGARRGSHDVMMRGTFANVRIKNEMLDGVEGGSTRYIPSGEQMPIYEAAMRYQAEGTPLVVIAGKEYGTGSSRDWAAKGTNLLGVKAVIAESFERIHRSNLVGMGVLPLTFKDSDNRQTLKLTGEEKVSIHGLDKLSPRMDVNATITRTDGSTQDVTLLCRIDTVNELEYYLSGGILQHVVRQLLDN